MRLLIAVGVNVYPFVLMYSAILALSTEIWCVLRILKNSFRSAVAADT